jgi:transcriptional regulator with XRE-family HTH domain
MVRGSVSKDDEEIGARIRLARLQRGLSQSELGESLDLSFQQVQKYEKGVNHVSAVRLCRIARLLGMPLEYFLENLDAASSHDRRQRPISSAAELVSSVEALALLTAFNRIRTRPLRKRCLALVQAVADGD